MSKKEAKEIKKTDEESVNPDIFPAQRLCREAKEKEATEKAEKEKEKKQP